MKQSRTLAGVFIVYAILVIGIIGWVSGSERYQVIFIVASSVILIGTLRVSIWRQNWQIARTLSSEKEFDRATVGRSADIGKNLRGLFHFGCVALPAGLVLLFINSSSPSITLLLWGIVLTLGGFNALVSGSRNPNEFHPDPQKAADLMHRMRYVFIAFPIMVAAIAYLMPPSFVLGGQDVILNIFGVVSALIAVAAFPLALWQAIERLFRWLMHKPS